MRIPAGALDASANLCGGIMSCRITDFPKSEYITFFTMQVQLKPRKNKN
jgi:hypothetical protein